MSNESESILSEQTARLRVPGPIVNSEWLAEQIDHPDLRILDVRPPEQYAAGHLPNAVQVNIAELSGVVDGVPGMLLPAEPFAARMGILGVDENKAVVIYDGNWGMPSARVLWSLARYGHDNAAALNGNFELWRQQGHAWTPHAFVPPRSHFTPRPVEERLATRDWLLARMGDDDLVVIDTRTALEYAQGHLPDALSWDWMNALSQGQPQIHRDLDALRTELESMGVTPDREIVTYCRSGARAAHTYLVLRTLGYERVRNYDGSWLEWSLYG
ncbi:MAG: sulfurtransferase [Caldilineaceae bacterium]|nr:sulfurtransferase [Caldilineaceae bacterium]